MLRHTNGDAGSGALAATVTVLSVSGVLAREGVGGGGGVRKMTRPWWTSARSGPARPS